MRLIVHIISGLGRGGAEKALTCLIEGHSHNPTYNHVVISLTTLGHYGAEIQQMGTPVYALGLNGPADFPRVFILLIRLLRKLQPNLIQTWMYHADLTGGIAAKFIKKTPVIWGIHSFDLKRGGKLSTRIIQKICAWTSFWLPNSILCVAEASRRVHIAAGYDGNKIIVVPNGFAVNYPEIDIVNISTFRTLYGLEPKHLVVGCIGRFHPAKDHRNFVEAAAYLLEEFPHARFMMVGSGLDAENMILISWLEELRIKGQFILLGERNDVPLCLKAMDIFCSPSRSEAFPLVVGEAMVMERASVVTDVGDTALLVGDTAVVVKCENSRALALGIASLFNASIEQREAIGRRAKARVCREFSIQRTLERIENVYVKFLKYNQ